MQLPCIVTQASDEKMGTVIIVGILYVHPTHWIGQGYTVIRRG